MTWRDAAVTLVAIVAAFVVLVLLLALGLAALDPAYVRLERFGAGDDLDQLLGDLAWRWRL